MPAERQEVITMSEKRNAYFQLGIQSRTEPTFIFILLWVTESL